MKEVLDFLKAMGTFYFATVDGDQPTVRPFAFFMEFEGKLYFGTSETRNVYQQLQTNPKFQISVAGENMAWLRITGKAHFDNRPEVFDAAAAAQPHIFSRNREHPDPNFKPVFFFVEEGKATFNTMPNQQKTIKL
jgi:uncharacterized pyridoxamine 5'-phosphate oxidase family protein